MKTYLDCMPCFLRQALEAARAATDDEDVHHQVINSVASVISEFPLEITPPEIAQRVYRVVADVTGSRDPFHKEKWQANQLALSLYPRLRRVVASSDDRLLTACKLAIAGNTIDLGPASKYADINSIVETALTSPLGIDNYAEFRESINNAQRILYLGDNAGEIVFDRVLIQELRRIKDLSVDFVVRESPIINDVTLADAVYVGLDRIASIISSGSDAPGTILSQCSPQMLRLYHSADIIIAKGQGNYESLNEERQNIFFLLKVKCPVITRLLGVNIGNAILMRQSTSALSD